MHDRTAWTRGPAGPKIIGRRTYSNLVEFSRKCASCGGPFSIFVTNKIAEGHADSNSFGLKNCEMHRRSGPKVETSELNDLRMANGVMREELAGLYARDKELFAEVQRLKARLSQYEVPSAMAVASLYENAEPFVLAPALTFPWDAK